jgi:pimeloyl-ACP methyl ester carboxylesterase
MASEFKLNSITAPTQFITVGDVQYAYRQFGSGAGIPLVCLQHFTGTLDNWDPAVTDRLAERRSVILFENAGVGRSTGKTPDTVAGMATIPAEKFVYTAGGCTNEHPALVLLLISNARNSR